jgi:hypothetical protein
MFIVRKYLCEKWYFILVQISPLLKAEIIMDLIGSEKPVILSH